MKFYQVPESECQSEKEGEKEREGEETESV